MMKLVAFLSCVAMAEGFGVLNHHNGNMRSSSTALKGNMLDSLVPHFDVVGQQGGGNLVEDHGWANVQGGSIVDWSVAPRAPLEDAAAERANSLPQLNDVVGEQGLVLTTKQNGMIVQGGSLVDWNDKQFMRNGGN